MRWMISAYVTTLGLDSLIYKMGITNYSLEDASKDLKKQQQHIAGYR